jgi:ribosomal protein L12E/L44/L45/RPP1/RPP2
MDKLELVQTALRQLGDGSAQELSAFIEKQHGVRIEAKFIPIFRASIRGKERLEAIRQAARAAVAQARAAQAATAARDHAA